MTRWGALPMKNTRDLAWANWWLAIHSSEWRPWDTYTHLFWWAVADAVAADHDGFASGVSE